MSENHSNTTGSELVAAIETFWAAVAERHPELPQRVIAVTGSGKVRGGTVLGHWAKGRWTTEDGRAPELFISGERMSDGGRGVATTVIHEAAHALLQARGDEDGGTSRQGRYHTKGGFGAAAVELGLELPETPDATLGFSDCTMPDITAEQYTAEIKSLDEALGAHIMMVTLEKLQAWAVVIGLIMGGYQTIIPWWLKSDVAGVWVGLGGGVAMPRAPRVRRPRVVLACGCREIKLPEAEAAELEDLQCVRCDTALERRA
jgi:hypothetical protein